MTNFRKAMTRLIGHLENPYSKLPAITKMFALPAIHAWHNREIYTVIVFQQEQITHVLSVDSYAHAELIIEKAMKSQEIPSGYKLYKHKTELGFGELIKEEKGGKPF